MNNLELSQFSSFFELISGFFIYMGFSNSLHDSVNIHTWIQSYIAEIDKEKMNTAIRSNVEANILKKDTLFIELSKEVEDLSFMNKIKVLFKFIIKLFTSKRSKHSKSCNSYIKFYKYYSLLFKCEENELLLYQDKDRCKENSGGLLKIISPVYLYFGITNFYLLIFYGMVESWDRSMLLQFINTISTLMVLWMLYRSLVLILRQKFSKVFPKRRIVLFQIPLFILYFIYLISCPSNEAIFHPSWDFNIDNFNILLCVILPLVPLLWQIMLLGIVAHHNTSIEKNYMKDFNHIPYATAEITAFPEH